MQQHLIWSTDPILLQIGGFGIHWYGVLFATAFGLGMSLMTFIFKREDKPVAPLDALLMYVGLGTLIGARLAHVVFYDPGFYFSHPLEILAIWKGGLASHGGAIGMGLGVYLFCRRHRDFGYLWLLDRIAIVALLGGALVRIGNFFNSEIAGIPTDLPWAVVFTRIDLLPRHPTQLYEAAAYLALFAGLFLLYLKRGSQLNAGFLSGLFLVSVFVVRFLLEFTKMQQASYEASLPLDVGQLLSVPAIVLGAVLMVLARRGRARA